MCRRDDSELLAARATRDELLAIDRHPGALGIFDGRDGTVGKVAAMLGPQMVLDPMRPASDPAAVPNLTLQ